MNSAPLLGRWLASLRALPSHLWTAEATFKGAHFGRNVLLIGRPLISLAPSSEMRIGNDVQINSALRSNPLGCFQPSVLRTLAPGAKLVLQDQVGISGTVLCAGREISIGSGTIIGAGAMLLDNDFHAPRPDGSWRVEYQEGARPILVGRNVFIGARAIILKGVTIGDSAIVGAGSVVSRDVAPFSIVAGNPAKPVGERSASAVGQGPGI